MLIGYLLVLLVPLVFLAKFVYDHLVLRQVLSPIPSARSLPFIGHVLITKPDVQGFVDQVMGMGNLYPNKPRMVVFWAGTFPSVMIYSAEGAKQFITNMNNLNKGMFYNMLLPWLGYSLLIREAVSWKPRRKLLTPTFHFDILKSFITVFNNQSEILIKQLHKYTKTNPDPTYIGSFLTLCTLDVICETSMGQSVNAQLEADSEYVRAIICINDIIQKRQKNPLMWNDALFWLFGDGKQHAWALNVLHSFTRKVIIERRKKIMDPKNITEERRLAFLDLLLEMERNGEIDEVDVRNEVDTFMFEGHDTTATGLTWALHLLGCHPEIQEKCYEEIQAVCGDSNYIDSDALGKLTYLECCLKESLRLYPSVPIIARNTGANTTFENYFVPTNTQLLINIFLIHRDPEHWPDPEVFNPDRFLQENSKGRHAFAYMPFSAGSRNCIGQRFALLEEKVILSWILRNFRVKSLLRRDQVRYKAELILRPLNPIPFELTARE